MSENPYKLKPEKMPRQAEYTGHSVWMVTHPTFGAVDVLARDMAGAIITASTVWGQRWQKYEFYAYCDVVRRLKSKKMRDNP